MKPSPTLKPLGTLVAAVLLLGIKPALSQQFVFDWADFGAPISDVEDGDSFTLQNVDNSGIDFTFSFSEVLDGDTNSSFNTIVNPDNPSTDFPDNFTENTDFEDLYTTTPLYLVGKSANEGDLVILDITTSAPVTFTDLVIGDIDRLVTGNGNSDRTVNSFEDRVTLSAFLDATQVDVGITTTSSTIQVDGNVAESVSGGLLDSSITDSQVNASTAGAVNRFRVLYQNGDGSGPGLSDSNDGQSNSHWITLGTDTQLTQFEVVPEPSAAMFMGCAGILLIFRRRV